MRGLCENEVRPPPPIALASPGFAQETGRGGLARARSIGAQSVVAVAHPGQTSIPLGGSVNSSAGHHTPLGRDSWNRVKYTLSLLARIIQEFGNLWGSWGI